MGTVIMAQLDNKSSLVLDKDSSNGNERLLSWDFKGAYSTPKQVPTPEEPESIAVYHGPPRVLEIGCSDGSWCFKIKKLQPEWIVEGVDDSNHWACVHQDIKFRYYAQSTFTIRSLTSYRDFMNLETGVGKPAGEDYLSGLSSTQENTEFTVRNLNTLLAHQNPFPHNLYGLIRGRDIFDRVESYKTFLEDVRL